MTNDHERAVRAGSSSPAGAATQVGVAEALQLILNAIADGNLPIEAILDLDAQHPDFRLHLTMLLGQLGHSVEVV